MICFRLDYSVMLHIFMHDSTSSHVWGVVLLQWRAHFAQSNAHFVCTIIISIINMNNVRQLSSDSLRFGIGEKADSWCGSYIAVRPLVLLVCVMWCDGCVTESIANIYSLKVCLHKYKYRAASGVWHSVFDFILQRAQTHSVPLHTRYGHWNPYHYSRYFRALLANVANADSARIACARIVDGKYRCRCRRYRQRQRRRCWCTAISCAHPYPADDSWFCTLVGFWVLHCRNGSERDHVIRIDGVCVTRRTADDNHQTWWVAMCGRHDVTAMSRIPRWFCGWLHASVCAVPAPSCVYAHVRLAFFVLRRIRCSPHLRTQTHTFTLKLTQTQPERSQQID